MEKLLKEVIIIAQEAGAAILAVYDNKNSEFLVKEDNSPITQADLLADRLINIGLRDLELGWPILTEESAKIPYSDRKNWTRFWLVDPLDGTKEFINRNGEFTVNIALIENGKPILGVVYSPALNILYYAAKGIGAYVKYGINNPQLIKTKSPVNGERIKVVASRSHINEETLMALNSLGTYECLEMGSSLKLCLVADGTAHLYPRLGPTMEWDTAAAHAVVNLADGVVCDCNGIELKYNKQDLHNPNFYVLRDLSDWVNSQLFES